MSTKLITEIENMDRAELNIVIDAVNRRQKMLSQESTRKFSIGDSVTFKTKSGEKIFGTVDKVNRKTIIVNEDNKLKQWKVSASLLESV